jgi:heme/copper-type cytochrome/quinol oxidase subunit 1
MTYFRMPVFCWTALTANSLIVAAFPILTPTFMMLDHVVHVSVAYARRALTLRSSC